jgi:hypothetical protein
MDLTPYLQSLRDDMLSAASIGDEQTRRSAALLTSALEPAARLAIMNALSDLAAEVTGALDDTTVDLRLEGRDLRVTVTKHAAADPDRAGWSGPEAGSYDLSDEDLGRAVRDAGGELSRTTLRLVNDLKSQAEQAATAQGVSLNTYIQRAVSDAVRSSLERGRGRRGGSHTVSGFVQG